MAHNDRLGMQRSAEFLLAGMADYLVEMGSEILFLGARAGHYPARGLSGWSARASK
jgi:hypothetical protein